jgi:hypothetical protein
VRCGKTREEDAVAKSNIIREASNAAALRKVI